MQIVYDVAIVGAGPGGSAAAHYLSREGLRVLLLDKSEFPRDKTCGDGLSPRAVQVLAEMAVLDAILPTSRRIKDLVIVSPAGRPIQAPIPKEKGLPSYGLVTRRVILDDVIRERAIQSGAEFHSQVRVVDVKQATGQVLIRGRFQDAPVDYRARIVVVATGASVSFLRRIRLLKRPPSIMIAARAYFEDLPDLQDRFQFYFEGVPLPGYGWIFPLSLTSANIGAGFLKKGEQDATSSHRAFQDFLNHPTIKRLTRGARRVGPVKGYPLLVGFREIPTFADRLLVIGEAAGLVNPLTGEGIDSALESAQLAARHLMKVFREGDFSREKLSTYDALLRDRFQKQFSICLKIRDAFMRDKRLDWVIRIGIMRPRFKMTLIRIALGLQEIPPDASWLWLFRTLFAKSEVRKPLDP